MKDKTDEKWSRLISQIKSVNVALEEEDKDIFKTAEDMICESN